MGNTAFWMRAKMPVLLGLPDSASSVLKVDLGTDIGRTVLWPAAGFGKRQTMVITGLLQLSDCTGMLYVPTCFRDYNNKHN